MTWHDVVNVEDEEQFRKEGTEEGHHDVRQALDEHLVADQRVEVVHRLHRRDWRCNLVPLFLVVTFDEFSRVSSFEV